MRAVRLALLLLLPLALVSCSVGKAAREAGEGAFDHARAWYDTEGEARVKALITGATDHALEKAGDEARKLADDDKMPDWAKGAAGVIAAALGIYLKYHKHPPQT